MEDEEYHRPIRCCPTLQPPLNVRDRNQRNQHLYRHLDHDAHLVQEHEIVEIEPQEDCVGEEY